MELFKITLLSISIFQGIIIGFILFKSPFFKNKANKYLAFAIFSLSLSLLKIALESINAVEHFPYLRVVEVIDSEMLFPTFILLFVIHQVNHPQKYSKKLRWLFAPAIISSVIVVIIDIFFGHYNEQNINLTYTTIIVGLILSIIIYLMILFFIPYVLFKTYKLIKYSEKKKEKKWLLNLWYFEVIVLGILMFLILVGPFIIDELSNAVEILALFSTFIIHWIAYTGIYKLKLINEQNSLRSILKSRMIAKKDAIDYNTLQKNDAQFVEQKPTTKKTKKFSKDNVHYKALKRLCSEQKIYRDNTLDRYKIANKLGISPTYVSQLINSIEGVNFSTFINNYRVEEVKTLILDDEFSNYSLLSIGLECGFSSKTTFYNAFKKITGVTPNRFKETHK